MSNRVGFVLNEAGSVIKIIHPTTPSDVQVEGNGALRCVDHDGEVHIFAAGTWANVRIEKEESR
jgi:hypothetical protein